MRPPSSRRPVFLDSTGRRRRMIRRTGVALAVPTVGYVLLTASSLFGGPRLDTPLIPMPEAVSHQPRPRTTPEPAAVRTPESTETPVDGTKPSADPTGEPTEQPSSTGTPTPSPPASVISVPVTVPTPGATTTAGPTRPTVGRPTVLPTTPAPTTTAPTATTTSHGNKPTAPPGKTKTPGKP